VVRGQAFLVAAVLAGTAACTGDVDEVWFLDHDRVVAVRATPPHVASGERAVIDALVAAKGQPTREASPELATVISPQSLAAALTPGGDGWGVTAPDEATLAAARTELGLDAGAPVPLQIGVSYAGGTLFALKTVWLGDQATNPVLDGLLVDGAPPPADALQVGREVEVRLAVTADPMTQDVNWLTSCGTMHDFDLPSAYLVVEADDPDAGELAVVLRDRVGGVTWRVWSLAAP
jgi:hypothetical protein